jgi:ribosomal protein S18 acetylase RimI-like enzyme
LNERPTLAVGYLPCLSGDVMSRSGFVPDIKRLDRNEWRGLRDLRLTALADSPDAFLATYSGEKQYDDARWQAEFDRGSWYICENGGLPVGLVGVVRVPQTPSDECALEFIWVSPGYRRSGVASDLVASVLKLLREAQYRLAHLWVLDGNDAAMGLYEKLGFVSTSEWQALEVRPGRSEQRMTLDLR